MKIGYISVPYSHWYHQSIEHFCVLINLLIVHFFPTVPNLLISNLATILISIDLPAKIQLTAKAKSINTNQILVLIYTLSHFSCSFRIKYSHLILGGTINEAFVIRPVLLNDDPNVFISIGQIPDTHFLISKILDTSFLISQNFDGR